MIPILLSFKNKKIVVFGCGEVGKRRALKLYKDGALVDIYSKNFDNDIVKINDIKKIKIDLNNVDDKTLKNIIKKYDIIIAAVNKEINKKIVNIAKELNKYVNSSTSIEESNFIIPAYVEKNGIIFFIYTGGKSPLLAKNIRKIVENYLDKNDIEFIDKFRIFLKDNIKNQKYRKRILEELFTNDNFKKELNSLIEKYYKRLKNDNFKSRP